MDYQTQYQEYKALADAALNTYFADTTVSYHRLLEAMHYSLTAGANACVRCWCSRSAQPAVGMCARRCQLRVRSRWCILIRSSTTICRAWITMICAAASRRTTWSMASARRRWRATPCRRRHSTRSFRRSCRRMCAPSARACSPRLPVKTASAAVSS